MSLPNELLDTAKYLLQRERTKPKQATLRRAISTAYYALFHLLIEEASAEFLRGKDSRKLQKVFRRVFEHTEMKEAAKSFANSALPDLLANVLGTRTVSPDLQQVATIFMNAQNKRHQADYDLQKYFAKREAQKIIDDIEQAFLSWHKIKRNLEATIFLFALFTKKRLDGRK